MTVLVNKDLEGSGLGLIMCLEVLNDAAWIFVVLRVSNGTRTRHLPHRGPSRLNLVKKRISTNWRQRRKETNKQGNKELRNGEKQHTNPIIKGCSYHSAAMHKHWNETRNHEIKYGTSDLFHYWIFMTWGGKFCRKRCENSYQMLNVLQHPFHENSFPLSAVNFFASFVRTFFA
jgi:hypothetical protein